MTILTWIQPVLYDEEIKRLLPKVFSALSGEVQKTQYIKVHDAYAYNTDNYPIIPTEPTKCGLYLIRNRLDIVASLANHMNSSTDSAIRLMNDPAGSLATQKNNLNVNNQLKQLMLDWSGHVQSWVQQTAFPVHIVRYEDMLYDPVNTFLAASHFMGIDTTAENVSKALDATKFEKLQHKEKQQGFREKYHASKSFFRSGKAGSWVNELTAGQAKTIISHHAAVMEQHGYSIQLDTVS